MQPQSAVPRSCASKPLAVKHREPHGREGGVGPVDTVTAMRRNIEAIPRTEEAGFGFVGKAQPRGAGEQNDPLAFGLVIPEAGLAGLAKRDDPRKTQPTPRQELIDAFGGPRIGEWVEQVHGAASARAGGAAASTPATARHHPA